MKHGTTAPSCIAANTGRASQVFEAPRRIESRGPEPSFCVVATGFGRAQIDPLRHLVDRGWSHGGRPTFGFVASGNAVRAAMSTTLLCPGQGCPSRS